MDYKKLKGLMVEKGITQIELANNIGINVTSLNAKLNNKRQFTVEEACKISYVLDIKDPNIYFFTNYIPNKQR